MRIRRLDSNNDMTFGAGSLNFYVDSTEGVAQNVYTRLKLWRGEWFQNTAEGTDYKGKCLEKNTADSAADEIRRVIIGTPGVIELNNFSYEIDGARRNVSISGELTTQYGKTSMSFKGSYSIGDL